MWISAFDSEDIEKVKLAVQDRLLRQTATFKVPLSQGDIIAQLHELGEIMEHDIDDDEEMMKITARIHPSAYERMSKKLEPYKESD